MINASKPYFKERITAVLLYLVKSCIHVKIPILILNPVTCQSRIYWIMLQPLLRYQCNLNWALSSRLFCPTHQIKKQQFFQSALVPWKARFTFSQEPFSGLYRGVRLQKREPERPNAVQCLQSILVWGS